MISSPADMNDKVRATIAALFNDFMSGNIQCLRVEYISPRGELYVLYTDHAMARNTDPSQTCLITEEQTEMLKDTLVVTNHEYDGVIH